MQNSWDPADFRGLHFPDGGQLRMQLTYDANGNALSLDKLAVRSDIWPHWLQIADDELTGARVARDSNPGPDGNEQFDSAIVNEYRRAMVSICAVAFTFEAFTRSVVEYFPNGREVNRPPDIDNKSHRSGAAARFHQVWIRAFRLSNTNSANTKGTLKQVFLLRNEAVHPPAEFANPVNHATYPVALEKRFLVYSVENAERAYGAACDALSHLLERPRGDDPAWIEWCAAMSVRLDLIQNGPAERP